MWSHPYKTLTVCVTLDINVHTWLTDAAVACFLARTQTFAAETHSQVRPQVKCQPETQQRVVSEIKVNFRVT